MSYIPCSDGLLSAWVNHVVKHETNHLGVWIHFQSVFDHFRQYNSGLAIIDRAIIKRKLNKLLQINRFFYKKDTYECTNEGYTTYYLITTENFVCQKQLESQFTHHTTSMTNYKLQTKNTDSFINQSDRRYIR